MPCSWKTEFECVSPLGSNFFDTLEGAVDFAEDPLHRVARIDKITRYIDDIETVWEAEESA